MSPKIVRIVVWVATTAIAIIMLAAGAPKLAASESLKEPFVEFGWPDPIYFLTGVAEVLGSIGLLVRQFRVAAAALIGFVMVGAAITNLVNGDVSFVSFNLILVITCGALAHHYASAQGQSIGRSCRTLFQVICGTTDQNDVADVDHQPQ